MRFEEPLIQGTLRRRYKRFLADIALAGELEVTAHCPNPGSMMGLAVPGSAAWCSRASNPKRKLHFTWELVDPGGGLVGINSAAANRLAEEAIRDGAIAQLGGYASLRREVRYGANSRVDLLLEDPARPPCYVEVKNVHLRRDAAAEFPDAVTARGAKHLRELAAVAAAGQRAVMFYVVQRADCDRFTIAADIDPAYAEAFADACAAGVEAICYRCAVTTDGIDIIAPLPISI